MKPTFPFACLGLLLCWSASSPEIRAAASPSTVIAAAGAAEPKTAIRNTRPIAAFPAVRTAAPDSGLLTATWETRWARDGESSPYDFGVYHFRRSFDLAARPETFVINITADNRYRLFVNGTPACWGSARTAAACGPQHACGAGVERRRAETAGAGIVHERPARAG